MKLIKSAILKNLLLTSTMVGASISTVMVIQHYDNASSTIGCNTVTTSTTPQTSFSSHGSIARGSSSTAFTNSSMPVVSTSNMTSTTASAAGSTSSTSVVSTPMGGSYTVASNLSTSGLRNGGGGASGGSGLSASTGLMAQATGLTRGSGSSLTGSATMASPFSTDSRPNVGVGTRAFDDDDDDDAPDDPEHPFINPLDGELWILLILSGLFVCWRMLRSKLTIKNE